MPEQRHLRIMTILGSPRAEGNTAKALYWVEKQIETAGHTVDRAHIMDYTVSGCRECLGCKSGLEDLCAVKDDANGLFERMLAADIVVFASPLFCWGFPSQLKALVDRMMCMIDYPDGPSKVEGKALGLLLTAGGPEADNAEYLLRGFDAFVTFLRARQAGVLFLPFCTTPSALGEPARIRAEQFAQTLLHAAA